MSSDSRVIYRSDFYKIIDFKCKCNLKGRSGIEYHSDFSLSYVRKGSFIYHVFRNSLDSYTGLLLLSKPCYEHTVTHFNGMPDECTTFSFSDEFYESLKNEYRENKSRFFKDNDIQSLVLKAGPEIDYLHNIILKSICTNRVTSLYVDSLVLELLYTTMNRLLGVETPAALPEKLKKNHLATIEKARQFISENFMNDISLFEIAGHCFVSPFHFSRIFKTFTSYSPHQFLLDTRLKHAELMIKSTDTPITQVCFSSGFQNLEHFSAAFRKKYRYPPSGLRK